MNLQMLGFFGYWFYVLYVLYVFYVPRYHEHGVGYFICFRDLFSPR